MGTDSAESSSELLSVLPLFAGLDPDDLSSISELVVEVVVDAGEVLTNEGELGYDSFIILDGSAEVTVAGRGIATLGPGSFVGEMALLDGKPRSATVRATTQLLLLLVDAAALAALLETPVVAARILSGVVQRLRETDAVLSAAARARSRLDRPAPSAAAGAAARAVAVEAEAWARAGIVPGARVVEVGCGPGAITAEIARIVGAEGEVVGVDRDADALVAARAEIAATGHPNARIVEGEPAATGLEAGTFDTVMMRNVLAHSGPRVPAVLDHVASLVCPGGFVYLTELTATGLHEVPIDPDLAEERARWLELMRRQGNDLAVGAHLGRLVCDAGLELAEFTGRYDISWLSELHEPGGGPVRSARGAMIAAGLASDEECQRWDAAAERVVADPAGRYLCIPVFTAIGRRAGG